VERIVDIIKLGDDMITLGLFWLDAKYEKRAEFLFIGTLLIDLAIVDMVVRISQGATC
jgi:hypothetical protein